MDEVCNLEDDDCDGEIDEGLDLPYVAAKASVLLRFQPVRTGSPESVCPVQPASRPAMQWMMIAMDTSMSCHRSLVD